MVTDLQVRLLRSKLLEGRTQTASAAAAGMSARTARRWRAGLLPSQAKRAHPWRTRPDPLAGVWESELLPLLAADTRRALRATSLLHVLAERHPEVRWSRHLRTLQRRIRDWRALHGPDREVFFEQLRSPGHQASIDFTDASQLRVTIQGRPLRHLIFQFVLDYCGWTWARVVFAENFETLSDCLQGALWALGGVPRSVRSDNLSALAHASRRSGRRILNQRIRDVLAHYGLRSIRSWRGAPHENGVVEQAHHRTKSALEQALVIRGSRDFGDLESYQRFVAQVVDRTRNANVGPRLAAERPFLAPLPACPMPSFTAVTTRVRRTSTVRVGGQTYSVPSRLIGCRVEARLFSERVDLHYRGQLTATLPRSYDPRGYALDYRHVIHSLVRKPGAMARSPYREGLFPSRVFRRGYEALRAFSPYPDAEYLRVLHLAAGPLGPWVERCLGELLARGPVRRFEEIRALTIARALGAEEENGVTGKNS